MNQNCLNKKNTLFFIEYTAVFVLLLIPPLVSAVPFTLPPKPSEFYAQCIFCLNTVSAAAYEEVLYRLYTPNRLHRIYTDYIEPQLPKNTPAAAGTVYRQHPLLSHIYSKHNTVVFFELLFTEFPALLLFTLAHRYLGFSSMLFAAGAGIAFRIAYLKLKRRFHPALSITFVAVLHGIWNIGVYYYLWERALTIVFLSGAISAA